MAICALSGRVLLGVLSTLWLVGCTAVAVSAPSTVDSPPIVARPVPSPSPTPADLRIALTEQFGGNVAVWMADAAGLFQQNQLVVSVERQPESAALMALAAGDLDVVVGTGGPVLVAALEGADLRFVAGLVNQYPYRFVVPVGVDGAPHLRGARIGIGRAGSASEAATRLALRQLRLDPGDVSLIQIGSPGERLAALENGAIQGVALGVPDLAALDPQAFQVLLDLSSNDVDAPVNQVIVAARLARQEPQAVERLVRALTEATALAKRDRELTKRVLAQYLGSSDAAALDETYEVFVQKLAPRAPYPAGLRDVLREMIESNPRAASLDPAVLVDRSFVQLVVDSGLLAQLYGEGKPAASRR
jgi:ABC-type nitrate/sulfonate/bicarbonate transport system substrate-binding protein